MKPSKLGFLFCVALTAFLLPASGRAQDFQQSYSIGPGGQIRIRNISGDVKVSGYNGSTIEVTGYKEGRDRDMVQIEDTSKGNLVELGVRYPEKSRNTNASVSFVVRVPQSVEYVFDSISSVSGDVEMIDVTGKIKAESVSGNVVARNVTGTVTAHSVSGDVTADIQRLQGTDDMKFSSISGDVHVTAPADLDADVKMSSVSGSAKTDFPIQIHEPKYGPGQSASAKLGTGARSLRLTSVSGDVSLKHIK